MIGQYSTSFRQVFDFYLRYKFKRGFQDVFYEIDQVRHQLDPHLPVIFVANHMSWWDGFFILELQKKILPEARHFTLMLERELIKFPFLRKIGAVGLVPADPMSVARTFLELRRLRRSSELMSLGFFPQGHIRPQQTRPLGFQKGLAPLVRLLHPVQVVPVGLQIEPMHNPKPSAWIRVGQVVRSDRNQIQIDALERQVTELLMWSGLPSFSNPMVSQRWMESSP